jgi:hypothetical protein
MNKNKEKKQKFYSIMEFESKYFPKAYKRRMTKKPIDAHALGSTLAKESLDKIKSQLVKL